MDIEYRKSKSKWIAEVWDEHILTLDESEIVNTVYSEDIYVEINDWCKESFGYHARTAYHIFEFKKRSHLDWFLLRWK